MGNVSGECEWKLHPERVKLKHVQFKYREMKKTDQKVPESKRINDENYRFTMTKYGPKFDEKHHSDYFTEKGMKEMIRLGFGGEVFTVFEWDENGDGQESYKF